MTSTTSHQSAMGNNNPSHEASDGRLTINEAASTTGWTARMLRYIEQLGLVAPPRSDAGYRLYGPQELQRLRTLRELLDNHELALAEVGFAVRLRNERGTEAAINEWLDARPVKPPSIDASEWLRFEQDKHQRLLASVSAAQLG